MATVSGIVLDAVGYVICGAWLALLLAVSIGFCRSKNDYTAAEFFDDHEERNDKC